MMSSLRKRVLITLGIFTIPLLLGLLITYEVIKIDWTSFMEVQPSFRPMEAPLPVPQDSVPVQGAAFVKGVGSPLNPIEADEVSLQRGQILYGINCAVCHGPEGKGDGPVAPFLVAAPPVDLTSRGVQDESDGALFVIISNGVEGKMPALLENLSVRERWDIVNYVKSGTISPVEVAAAAGVQRTPIPTLIPAAMPSFDLSGAAAGPLPCSVGTLDLLDAWVSAGLPETEPFDFTDANTGEACQGTFSRDVQKLFTEANLWYDGAVACSSCHGADITVSAANMDLTSYAGILAGSYRVGTGPGDDILGGGNWTDAILFDVLSTGKMPLGRPPTIPLEEHGPIIVAGTPK